MPNVAPRTWEENENARVFIPKAMRACLVNHRHVPATHERGSHYVSTEPYQHQEYPKMLYHPRWNEVPEPRFEYFRGVDASGEWMRKHLEWEQSDYSRTIVANSANEEKRLVAKGWLVNRPDRKLTPVGKAIDEV